MKKQPLLFEFGFWWPHLRPLASCTERDGEWASNLPISRTFTVLKICFIGLFAFLDFESWTLMTRIFLSFRQPCFLLREFHLTLIFERRTELSTVFPTAPSSLYLVWQVPGFTDMTFFKVAVFIQVWNSTEHMHKHATLLNLKFLF